MSIFPPDPEVIAEQKRDALRADDETGILGINAVLVESIAAADLIARLAAVVNAHLVNVEISTDITVTVLYHDEAKRLSDELRGERHGIRCYLGRWDDRFVRILFAHDYARPAESVPQPLWDSAAAPRYTTGRW